MNKDDVFILIVVLFAIAIVVAPAIYDSKRDTNVIEYCFEKYQNLEDIKACKEIFYK